ncbi:hypothetical protein J2Z21_008620 [Streptomyces griseochromogenes]|uniref:Uncharacterized protein n=1 Tax=Streptomyces griseochromogenes TaxID=68214 RepID=A0ABS4M7F4_9ACTN|nr:hypothetical protein [Streptomyces griseochromogenes]MBP2055604.1 hypothetical protein [Streptomyces griseochromogenes]
MSYRITVATTILPILAMPGLDQSVWRVVGADGLVAPGVAFVR